MTCSRGVLILEWIEPQGGGIATVHSTCEEVPQVPVVGYDEFPQMELDPVADTRCDGRSVG